MWTKNDLSELLRNGKLEVSFIKKDGNSRLMLCSLEEKYLPPMMEDAETVTKDNPDVLSVWDMENNGWRSFHVSKVKEVL